MSQIIQHVKRGGGGGYIQGSDIKKIPAQPLIWSQQDPGGPHAGPMNFAFWVCTLELAFTDTSVKDMLVNGFHNICIYCEASFTRIWIYVVI